MKYPNFQNINYKDSKRTSAHQLIGFTEAAATRLKVFRS